MNNWREQVLRPYSNVLAALADGRALQSLSALCRDNYVPWTTAAMRPRDVVTVVNDIILGRRQCIVELGAGATTLVLGAAAQKVGGHLTSVEHNAEWVDVVQRLVADAGLTSSVHVVNAPLVEEASPWGPVPWYEFAALSSALHDEHDVDVLLVDGPVAGDATTGHPHSRFPAVPRLQDVLAPDALVVLDDAHRPGERQIITEWESRLDGRFQSAGPRSRASVLHRSHAWHV